MIWSCGRLLRPEQLALPLDDRIFEHGLGLFETCRTWEGRAPLLDRHLDRLRRSAADLGIPLAESALPDEATVASLLEANGLRDGVIRLTVSGGGPAGTPALAWMTARPVPPDLAACGIRVRDNPWPVALADPLARHKTLNYWSRRLAHEQAQAAGAEEAIFAAPDGSFWEGSRTSLVLVAGRTLITPPLAGPIIPGIMRRVVLDVGRQVGYAIEERPVDAPSIAAADEVFLTNSVRGLIAVREWVGRFDRPRDPQFTQTCRLRRQISVSLGIPGPRS